jgi:hypothetical protein
MSQDQRIDGSWRCGDCLEAKGGLSQPPATLIRKFFGNFIRATATRLSYSDMTAS